MSSSKNLENFSFLDSNARPAAATWSNPRTSKPLNLHSLRGYTSGELLNPYTRQKWMDLALQLSSTQLTQELLSKIDFETYKKVFTFMKEYLAVVNQEENLLKEELAQAAKAEKELSKNESKMSQMEEAERQKEREFRQEIQKIEAKRKKLNEKYDDA